MRGAQFTFAVSFYFAASYQLSMLNVHEVLWLAPTTQTSQMNHINDYHVNTVHDYKPPLK